MANDTSRGGTDADRIQMTWDEGDWRTLRYGSGTKTWKFDPSTRVFAKRDGQGKYLGRLDQTDYRFDFLLEDAWTNEAYVLQDTISISECPGDFSQETIDRGCVIGNDIAYSDGTRVDPAFIHRNFRLSLIASETLPPGGPRCTIDPYKTYYVNIKSSLPGQRQVIGAHFGGPNIFDSATYFTTSLWSYNKARAPYARKPCSGWHCERTDPHRDWYGNAEVGASDDFVGPVSGK